MSGDGQVGDRLTQGPDASRDKQPPRELGDRSDEQMECQVLT